MLSRFFLPRLRDALAPDLRRLLAKDMRKPVQDLKKTIAELESQVAEVRNAHRLFVVRSWVESRAALLQDLEAKLSIDSIGAHVRSAVRAATIVAEPTAHLVIENLLPPDFYQLVNAAIPPAEMFPAHDPVKQDFHIDTHLADAPLLTQRVWGFFDDQVVSQVLAPALHERFQDAVIEHYAEGGGAEFGRRAAAIPHRGFTGRLHLRRPGYRILPHLDPKRVVITGLVYFARPGDSEEYGTHLYRIKEPFVSSRMGKFYPEREGLTCEIARTVPFRPNTLFAFVNSKAAHGAELPVGASLQERYAYQFYVKPRDGELKQLLRELPPEERTVWADFVE